MCLDYLRGCLIAFYADAEANVEWGIEAWSTELWERFPFLAHISAELHQLLNSDKFRIQVGEG